MISYHELAVNQPRGQNIGQQRQMLAIGTIMVAVFLYTFATAGGFQAVETSRTAFPGGDFCYKLTSRDYAASMSLVESIGKDAGLEAREADDGYLDAVYTVYLDAPMSLLSADKLRFAVGHLAKTTTDVKRIHRDVLMQKNKHIVPLTKTELGELPVQAMWPRLVYKSTHLPKVKQAIVAQFPFTDGLVSALMFTYKVMPSLLKQAKDSGMKEPIVVMSTCSVRQRMCTHYALSGKPFLLGQPATDVYASTIKPDSWFPWTEMKQTMRKPLVWIGIVQDQAADGADEL